MFADRAQSRWMDAARKVDAPRWHAPGRHHYLLPCNLRAHALTFTQPKADLLIDDERVLLFD